MDSKKFSEIVEQQLEYSKSLLNIKGSEYNEENDDRLKTFKIAANLSNKSNKQALAGMMIKHTVSIYDFINRDAKGENISISKWEEKITDHINYLLLLKALIIEEKE